MENSTDQRAQDPQQTTVKTRKKDICRFKTILKDSLNENWANSRLHVGETDACGGDRTTEKCQEVLG